MSMRSRCLRGLVENMSKLHSDHGSGEPDRRDRVRELLALYRKGDAGARAQLFEMLADREVFGFAILCMARRFLPATHAARQFVESADIVNSAIGSGMRRLDEFRGESTSQLLAWLRTILRSKVKASLSREVNVDLESVEASACDYLDQIVDRELREALRAAIDELPESYRIVVELRLQSASTAEISEFVGISRDAVRQRESRATAALRGLMAEHLTEQ